MTSRIAALFAATTLGLAIAAAGVVTLAQSTTSGPVRHVVVFKYKPTATPDQIRQVTQAFAALQQSIPGITAFEHGVNNSPENRSRDRQIETR